MKTKPTGLENTNSIVDLLTLGSFSPEDAESLIRPVGSPALFVDTFIDIAQSNRVRGAWRGVLNRLSNNRVKGGIFPEFHHFELEVNEIVGDVYGRLFDYYRVIDLHALTESCPQLDVNHEALSASERKLMKAFNEFMLESAETKRGAELKLLDSGLHQTTEAGLVLMQRFAKKRDEFLKKNKVVGGSEFAKLLGISDTNVARALGRKRAKGQVLSATLGDAEVYPLLQLNERAQVYPALVSRLPDMYEHAHGWDIVFWLMETRTVQTKLRVYNKADLSKYGHDDAFNMDALLDDLDGEQSDSDVVTAAPLSLLQSGQDDLFSLFVDEWLNVSDMALPIEPAGQ